MTNSGERWAVVGAGVLGLTLARRLADRGHEVVLYEAAPEVGGLASAWTLGEGDDAVIWDRHYHVTLLSDARTRAMLADLGLEDDVRWVETKTGVYADGQLHSVSNSVEYLRFPALNLVDKARLATTILAGSRMTDWRTLEQQPVDEWLIKWSGKRTFERFWLPLLRAKLGDGYRDASAAFIWATIQRLYAARRSGLKKELFGYVAGGGYAKVLDRYVEVLREQGVDLRLGTRVESVRPADDGAERRLSITADGATEAFDGAVVTLAGPLAARLCPDLDGDERRRLEGTSYMGIVCASLLLKRPLGGYYLTYLTDDGPSDDGSGLPFTAVVEMTAFVDPAEVGGHHLVYLPRYVPPDHPLFDASDEEVRERFEPALRRLYPDLAEDDVLAFRVSRVRQVFAVPTLRFSEHVPPMHTSVPGLHLAGSAHLLNATLNVDDTLGLVDEVLEGISSSSAARPPRALAVSSADKVPAVPAPPVRRPALTDVAGADRRPVASLSLDLDNWWSYQKTHGDPGWDSFPTYLDVVVPRILEVCGQRNLTITVFVVGQDAADPRNHDALRALADAGHEIGNHSFRHEPWMHRWSREATDDELARTEEAIEAATGTRPTGFRGPGYALSETTLEVLIERGYAYDASTLPTWIGPLARAYYFRSAKLSAEQRAERAGLFGHVADAKRRLKPYRWDLGGGRRLLELPVTVLPWGRVPLHPSYLLYLAGVRPELARAYFAASLRTCRLAKVEPSILLHPLDLLGGDDLSGVADQDGADLGFFPAMEQPGAGKVQLIGGFLDQLARSYQVVTMAEHVADLERRGGLDLVAPTFRDEDELDVEPVEVAP